jgi:hypothetical protein
MTAKDGSQCSRRVSDGSTPPVCHIHRAQQQGTSVSPLTQPVDLDETRSSDERIRLRAAELIIELNAKNKKPQEMADYTRFIKALSAGELVKLRDLVTQIRFLKEAVYDRLPHLRPAHAVPLPEVAEPTPREPVQQTPLAESHPTAPAAPPDPDELITVETLNHGPRQVTRRELENSRI